ncbi:MAG: dTDP-4-amino-4,6-dideoxygalactose transaminase [Verrucomicrobiota bacterium]
MPTSDSNIPFNRQASLPGSLEHVVQSIQRGHCSGDGPYTKKCEKLLEETLGVPRLLLTTSCTHALEMAALLLDVGPGDEVIVPSFTFVSTANAFALRGATIRFCDIRSDTLNLNPERLEEMMTSRTRAVVPVHYGGVGCEMEAIGAIARRFGTAVVEDNAHGLFGKLNGRWLGTFGSLATQSFHETKNFSCGEGGALIINDERLIERAEVIREKGTNRSRFFRGEIDKYSWVDLGSSYVVSDVLAALLYGQLDERDKILAKRKEIWNRYFSGLKDWADRIGAELPHVPKDCEQGFHLFYMIMPTLELRQRLIEFLKQKGVAAVFHYVPLHLSEFASRWGSEKADCPVSSNVSDRLIRLPFYYNLSESELNRVISAVQEFG